MSTCFLFCGSHFTVRGRPFRGNSPNIIQVPLDAKIPPWWKGCVCVCARVCVCVRSCACACVCLSLLGRGLREYEQTTITVTFHGVLEALRQPRLALRESQLRQAGAAIRLGFVKCKIRSIKCPRSQSCCCHLGLSRGPASWPGVDSPASHGGTERGLPLSRLLQKPTLSDARSQKGPTGFCALVCD